MRNIRIGIIGAGSFAIGRARRFGAIEGVSVTLGWSRSERSRERFRGEIGAPTVADWRQVCESEQVDAVVVSTPHVFHFEQARAALANGKHVLVETPLCLQFRQAQELADLAAQGSLVVHHGRQFRYHPDYGQEIENLHSAGPLVYAERTSCYEGGPQRPWYRDFSLSGGAFSFLSWAVTDFFEAFGNTVEVDGRHVSRGKLDVATMWVRFAGGGEAEVTYGTGEGIPYVDAGTVIGAEGIVQWAEGWPKRLLKAEEVIELPRQRDLDTVLLECEAFVDEVRGQRDHRPTFDLDLRILKAVSEAQSKAEQKDKRSGREH